MAAKKEKLEKGIKYDDGKLLWHLLPYDAIKEVVKVFTRGSKKYEERNWEKGMEWHRVYNGVQRHLTDWFQNRAAFDPGRTGLRQIAQAAWGCIVLTAYELRGVGIDTRPPIKVVPFSSIFEGKAKAKK